MDYVHECAFCGWHRPATSPTILAPACPACGCMLSSARRPADDETPAVTSPPALRAHSPLARFGARLAAAVFMVGSAKAGYDAGGVWMALGGLSAMGLLTVPLLAPDG
jgi:hypothetical protein